MALSQASGVQTIGTLVNLFFSETTLKTYATMIFFHNLTLGDSIEITIYVNDLEDLTERIYDQFLVSDAQTNPGTYIPPLPTNSYRITAEKKSGTDREITWTRSEYT